MLFPTLVLMCSIPNAFVFSSSAFKMPVSKADGGKIKVTVKWDMLTGSSYSKLSTVTKTYSVPCAGRQYTAGLIQGREFAVLYQQSKDTTKISALWRDGATWKGSVKCGTSQVGISEDQRHILIYGDGINPPPGFDLALSKAGAKNFSLKNWTLDQSRIIGNTLFFAGTTPEPFKKCANSSSNGRKLLSRLSSENANGNGVARTFRDIAFGNSMNYLIERSYDWDMGKNRTMLFHDAIFNASGIVAKVMHPANLTMNFTNSGSVAIVARGGFTYRINGNESKEGAGIYLFDPAQKRMTLSLNSAAVAKNLRQVGAFVGTQ